MTTRSAMISAVLLAATAAPASAGRLDGWNAGRDDCAPCTRHAQAEYRCAHERSRHLTELNCGGLAAYAEATRFGYNRQALAAYQAESPRPAAPAPSTAAPPPPVSPPTPRADSAAEPTPAEAAPALPR